MRMRFWAALSVLAVTYLSAIAMVMAAFAGNNEGVVMYGIGTMVSGAVLKYLFEGL